MKKFLIFVTLFTSCHGHGIQHKADKMCERMYHHSAVAVLHVDAQGESSVSCEYVTEDMLEWCLIDGHKCVSIPPNK